MFSVDLNPDKKRPIREAVQVLSKLKDSNTVIIVTPKDLIPTFAYHFDESYFKQVSNEGEYVLIERNFKQNNVLFKDQPTDINSQLTKTHKKIILFTLGAEIDRNDFIKTLKVSNKLIFQKSYNGSFYLCVFNSGKR